MDPCSTGGGIGALLFMAVFGVIVYRLTLARTKKKYGIRD